MSRRTRTTFTKLFGLLLILSLGLALQPAAMAQRPSVDDLARLRERLNPTTKIHPNLLTEVKTAEGGKDLQFVARIKVGTDLSAYTDTWVARPFIDPLGNTVAVGTAKPTEILKLASLDGVITLRRPESLVQPPAPVEPDLAEAVNRNAARSLNLEPVAGGGPAPEGWYHTGSAIHGAQQAWAKGYTGEGVRHMVNDSGADYCHADLHGTWAYIDDPASPYYGLPQMFDSFSSYNAALDFYLGQSNVANGRADYADTSATARSNFSYAPLGAAGAHDYTVPGTSKSGVYHYGSHPDKALAAIAATLSGAFGDGAAVRGERAAILVVDENTAGVYDTVYVDLNYNFDFSDDKPARLSRDFGYKETACLDYNGDGLNDVSGGLVYFISDGSTALPTLDWYWGVPGSAYGNGDLVAFHVMDYLEGGGDHGMGCTSVAVGQGVVRGSLIWGPEGPPQAEGKGLVVGPGKDVMSTQNGNYYITPFIEDAYIYAGLGYDGVSGTGDDVQIVSNSWGFSGTDNDGFDKDSRLIEEINREVAPNTALLFSTGNGAAGYGTNAPPSPASSIGIGASTLYGSVGDFEAIKAADQIIGGDPMSWSNRGPGVNTDTGADVVATGAFGTGSVSLNQVLDGSIATGSFGGTSMAGPVAAGNLALIYDAWRERTGSWPTFDQAKALLMGTAKNTGHDIWSQGGGLVDADTGTDAAAGLGDVYATPSEWSVGSYRGEEYPAFANIVHPGQIDTQTFTLWNHSNKPVRVRLDALELVKMGTKDYSFRSFDQSLDHGAFTTPDYAFRIDQDIPPGTEMLQVRVQKPYEQFDPDDNQAPPFNNWRVHIQNWTDLDGDGKFWVDANNNGKVDLTGEMETGEHIRFTYGYNTGPSQQARIGYPLKRMADGILLTLRHRDEVASVSQTDLTIEASYWRHKRWPWLRFNQNMVTIPARSSATFNATFFVPPQAPNGMYEGSIVASYSDDGRKEVIIPVTVAVAAQGTNFEFGKFSTQRSPYDNANMFGYTDYNWRAESGDWRFYWTDVAASNLPAEGTPYLVVDNVWLNEGTDIDTIILGPTEDKQATQNPAIYGPYTLGEVGRSAYTYVGSGRWRYQTSSGGPREIVAAPVSEGLHGIMLHQVKVDGSKLNDRFYGQAGLVTLNPGAISGTSSRGSAPLTIDSEIALSGFVARGFGLGAPETTTGTVNQDDPNDPSSASFTTTVEINNGALLEVSTGNAIGNDLDLYVYGPDGSLLGSSTTPTDEEFVSILFPADGTYTIAVQGWSVPAGSTSFDLTVNAVQGNDVTVSDLPSSIPAGGSATLTVNWATAGKAPGTYYGLVLMGPADAPALFRAPVEVTIE